MANDPDIAMMCMFLMMSREVLSRYKQKHKLTIREKYICFCILVRTFESLNNLNNKVTFAEKFITAAYYKS